VYLKMLDDEINAILSATKTALSLEYFSIDDKVALVPINLIGQLVFERPSKKWHNKNRG
jgi:hypothetical protein